METSSIKTFFAAHKTLIGFVTVIVLACGGYIAYQKVTAKPVQPVRYVTTPVRRDVLVVSIPGGGQVLAEDQLDVKPLASGKLLKLSVKEGDAVTAGQVIAQIDQRDALKNVTDASQSVRSAQISLDSSRLSLEKLKKPATAASLLQAQDALNQAQRDLSKLTDPPKDTDLRAAQADVDTATYNARLASDGQTPQIVRNAYDDLVPLLTSASTLAQNSLLDVDAILGVDNQNQNTAYVRVLSSMNPGYRVSAEAHYQTAKRDIAAAKDRIDGIKYQNEDITRLSDGMMLMRTALQSISLSLKDTRDAILNTVPTQSFSQSNLDSLRSTIQSDITNVDTKQSTLVSQQTTIDKARDTYRTSQIALEKAQIALDKLKQGPDARDVAAAQEKVKERQQALDDLKKGPEAIDLASAQNDISQRLASLDSARRNLAEVQATLADYTVHSPFDGVIVKVNSRLGDTVSPSTAMVNLATHQKIAQISLNEIDVSKVKLGQKATLSFDAIEGLTITGEIVQIDQAGTVSQGVVNYNVKIGFDTSDVRVRSGMSVQASIITQTQVNALVVPNAAVKTSGSQSYVEVMTSTQPGATPVQKNVEVGLVNDTDSEIISGVNEGEDVVTQTIQPTSAATTRAPTTGGAGVLGIPGLTGGGATRGAVGGGNFRVGGTTGR